MKTIFDTRGKDIYGDGNGHGHSNGNGNGNGNGYGDGRGNGYVYGYGYGDGRGYGDGNGNGEGNGDGTHIGNGLGYGEMFLLDPIIAYHRPYRSHSGKSYDADLQFNAGDNIELCHWGLHACLDAKDTDFYSEGPLTKVACSGLARFGSDKLVCEHRVIAAYVVEQLLKEI